MKTKAKRKAPVRKQPVVTDAQITKLLGDPEHGALARAALMDPKQHGSLARRVAREARKQIAAIVAERDKPRAYDGRYSRPIKIF